MRIKNTLGARSGRIQEGLEKAEKEILAGKGPHVSIVFLAVLPEKQNQGVGKRIGNVLLNAVDRLNLPCFTICSSKELESAYKKVGFETVKEVNEEDPVDGDPFPTHYCMLRPAAKSK